jgi:hypothetical protein
VLSAAILDEKDFNDYGSESSINGIKPAIKDEKPLVFDD